MCCAQPFDLVRQRFARTVYVNSVQLACIFRINRSFIVIDDYTGEMHATKWHLFWFFYFEMLIGSPILIRHFCFPLSASSLTKIISASPYGQCSTTASVCHQKSQHILCIMHILVLLCFFLLLVIVCMIVNVIVIMDWFANDTEKKNKHIFSHFVCLTYAWQFLNQYKFVQTFFATRILCHRHSYYLLI